LEDPEQLLPGALFAVQRFEGVERLLVVFLHLQRGEVELLGTSIIIESVAADLGDAEPQLHHTWRVEEVRQNLFVHRDQLLEVARDRRQVLESFLELAARIDAHGPRPRVERALGLAEPRLTKRRDSTEQVDLRWRVLRVEELQLE